jgi:hypothetical protein
MCRVATNRTLLFMIRSSLLWGSGRHRNTKSRHRLKVVEVGFEPGIYIAGVQNDGASPRGTLPEVLSD